MSAETPRLLPANTQAGRKRVRSDSPDTQDTKRVKPQEATLKSRPRSRTFKWANVRQSEHENVEQYGDRIIELFVASGGIDSAGRSGVLFGSQYQYLELAIHSFVNGLLDQDLRTTLSGYVAKSRDDSTSLEGICDQAVAVQQPPAAKQRLTAALKAERIFDRDVTRIQQSLSSSSRPTGDVGKGESRQTTDASPSKVLYGSTQATDQYDQSKDSTRTATGNADSCGNTTLNDNLQSNGLEITGAVTGVCRQIVSYCRSNMSETALENSLDLYRFPDIPVSDSQYSGLQQVLADATYPVLSFLLSNDLGRTGQGQEVPHDKWPRLLVLNMRRISQLSRAGSNPKPFSSRFRPNHTACAHVQDFGFEKWDKGLYLQLTLYSAIRTKATPSPPLNLTLDHWEAIMEGLVGANNSRFDVFTLCTFWRRGDSVRQAFNHEAALTTRCTNEPSLVSKRGEISAVLIVWGFPYSTTTSDLSEIFEGAQDIHIPWKKTQSSMSGYACICYRDKPTAQKYKASRQGAMVGGSPIRIESSDSYLLMKAEALTMQHRVV